MKEFKLLRSGIKRKIDTIHKLRKKVTKENIYKVTKEIEENTALHRVQGAGEAGETSFERNKHGGEITVFGFCCFH